MISQIDAVFSKSHTWADRVFLFSCERNLDPPQRCPGCRLRLVWGISELSALDEGRATRCPQCRFDFAEDRKAHPLRYALE